LKRDQKTFEETTKQKADKSFIVRKVKCEQFYRYGARWHIRSHCATVRSDVKGTPTMIDFYSLHLKI